MIIIDVILLGYFNISKLGFGDWMGSGFREVFVKSNLGFYFIKVLEG